MAGNVEEKMTEIVEDRTHGAAFLAREALRTMRLAADESEAEAADSFLREMAELGCRLVSLRPSMSSPIANGVVRVFDAIFIAADETGELEKVRHAACEAVDRLVKVAEENVDKIVRHASEVIPRKATIMTHSYSETCLRAMLGCVTKDIRVLATESRPLLEGRRMAESLRKGGVEVTLLTDAQAGHFMRDVQLVLVGADTILEDGSIINKTGTYLVALAAEDQGVPFYVCCDSWKMRIESGVPELEEKSAEEVIESGAGVPARNVYFDVTPPHLVTGMITEDGMVSPEEVAGKYGRWKDVLEKMKNLGEW